MSAKKAKRLSKSQLNRKKKEDLVATVLDIYSLFDEQEDRIKTLANQLKNAQDKLVASQQSEDSMHPANATEVMASKSSLRIDLYPHQKQYRGKLEHILSGDRLVFTREDQKAVFDFFDKHQPLIDEDLEMNLAEDQGLEIRSAPRKNAPEESPSVSGSAHADRLAAAANRPQNSKKSQIPLATASIEASSTTPKKFSTFYNTMKPLANRLMRREPFNARLTLDLTTLPSNFGEQIDYRVAIHARRLGDQTSYLITQVNGSTTRSDTLCIETPAMKLSTGKYRLETMVSLSSTDGIRQNKMHQFKESNLIYIH